MAVPLAQKEARRAGILASLTLAQAIVESNWGRSILATGGHNYFGIKGDWLGKSITKNTASISTVKRSVLTLHSVLSR